MKQLKKWLIRIVYGAFVYMAVIEKQEAFLVPLYVLDTLCTMVLGLITLVVMFCTKEFCNKLNEADKLKDFKFMKVDSIIFGLLWISIFCYIQNYYLIAVHSLSFFCCLMSDTLIKEQKSKYKQEG